MDWSSSSSALSDLLDFVDFVGLSEGAENCSLNDNIPAMASLVDGDALPELAVFNL